MRPLRLHSSLAPGTPLLHHLQRHLPDTGCEFRCSEQGQGEAEGNLAWGSLEGLWVDSALWRKLSLGGGNPVPRLVIPPTQGPPRAA